MAWYSYKYARQFIPEKYTGSLFKQEHGFDYEPGAGYMCDQWISSGMYMRDLRAELCRCYGIIQKCASTNTSKKIREELKELNAFDNDKIRIA